MSRNTASDEENRRSSPVLAGILGFLGATVGSLTVPHVVSSDVAVGVLIAFLTGLVVFIGLLAVDWLQQGSTAE